MVSSGCGELHYYFIIIIIIMAKESRFDKGLVRLRRATASARSHTCARWRARAAQVRVAAGAGGLNRAGPGQDRRPHLRVGAA